MYLPLTIKEIQGEYFTSPYFKDLYLYLAQNKLPNKKSTTFKIENLAEKCILLDSILFKLVTAPHKETALLAVPEICADKIITLYHASLFMGHQGVVKACLTISDKFFYPRSCTLFEIIHKRVSYLPDCKNREATNKAIITKDLSKL